MNNKNPRKLLVKWLSKKFQKNEMRCQLLVETALTAKLNTAYILVHKWMDKVWVILFISLLFAGFVLESSEHAKAIS